MNSKLTLTKRKRLLLATVVICTVLIAGLAILWQSGKVSEAAVLDAHPGLVGWWRFDEDTGTVASDNTTNGNNGAITGASWVAGKYGYALSFSGSANTYVTLSSIPITSGNSFTFASWFKRTGASEGAYHNIVFAFTGTTYWTNIIISSDGTSLFAILYDGSGTYQQLSAYDTPFGDNNWHFISWTFDGSTEIVYIDGINVGQKSVSGLSASNSGTAYIGNNGYNSGTTGVIDEVQIYNRALSAAEIQAYYQSLGFSTNVLAKVPAGTTDFIATLSWQGTGSINVTIQPPSMTYTEANATAVYQKTTYSASSSTMLNIKRLEVTIGALASAQNWSIILVTSNVQDYQISVEVQR